MATLFIKVPATSANLGPGFDTLGLALACYNQVRLTPSHRFSLTLSGLGADKLPADERNLSVRVFRKLFEEVGKEVPAIAWEVHCGIPLERGLGSSAAAVVAGLVGANALLDHPFSQEELLRRATEWEGHPDNVAPALFGGLTLALKKGREVLWAPIPLPVHPGIVLAVPPFPLSTGRARAAIPAQIQHSDAVFNLGHVTLLTLALGQGRLKLLSDALSDRLHEPYREALVPGMAEVRSAAKAVGAYGVVLSGAGPTLLAFCPPELTERVAEAMQRAWPRSRIFPCPIEEAGTGVSIEDEK